jgi:type VI secretion system protein ImpM
MNGTAVTVGFFGKIPSRGDFIRAGLSQDFTRAWDGWLQDVLPVSRRRFGAHWDEAWRAAPIWRFALAAGQAGPRPVLGLLLPSIDRAGRQFPLTIAAEGTDDGLHFLDEAEAAGWDAVVRDLTPDGLLACLRQIPTPPACTTASAGRWWSDSSVEDAATFDHLPDAAAFAGMLAR